MFVIMVFFNGSENLSSDDLDTDFKDLFRTVPCSQRLPQSFIAVYKLS